MTQSTPATTTSRRIKPTQIALGIGIGFAAVTVASGIAATVQQWHDDSDVQREVFGNIPSAWKAVFYTVVPVLIVYGAMLFAQRVQNWERGQPDDRATTTKNVGRRLEDFRAGVYMQTLLRDPAAGVMHSLIYFSFIVLLAVTTVLEINHQLPEALKFLHGDVYQGYALVGDVAGLLFVVGVVWAIVRRYVQRPYRIRIKTKPEHAVILGTFLVLGVTGFVAEAFRIALDGRPDFEKWSFVGYPLSGLVDGCDSLAGWHQALVDRPRRSRFFAVPGDPADHHAAAHVHVAAEHVPARPRAAQGRDEADAQPDGDRARDLRRRHRRGLHLEAAARHRRLHHVRPLHVGVPGARHRQAARPPRDRAQDRRGHGPHRHARGVAARSASTPRSRSAPTRCSSASPPRRCGPARRARRATRSARSTSRSSTRSSTCGATCR